MRTLLLATIVIGLAGCQEKSVSPPPDPPGPPPPTFEYQAIDLGMPGSLVPNTLAIDDASRVFAVMTLDDGQHLFRWENGSLTDVARISGRSVRMGGVIQPRILVGIDLPPAPDGSEGRPVSRNREGDVVGTFGDDRPMIWWRTRPSP